MTADCFISQVRNPSLYLSQFVPNSERDTPTPGLVFASTPGYGGYYVAPFRGEWWVGSMPIDATHGLLVCGIQSEDVIAHEWRHHWQHVNGWTYDGVGFDPSLPYETAIWNYFTYSRSERDALMFSTRTRCSPWLDTLKITPNPKYHRYASETRASTQDPNPNT